MKIQIIKIKARFDNEDDYQKNHNVFHGNGFEEVMKSNRKNGKIDALYVLNHEKCVKRGDSE